MRPCSSGSRAVPTRGGAPNSGVLPVLLPTVALAYFPLLPLLPPLSWLGCTVDGHHDGGGATERALGLRGWGFYSRARPWSSVIGGWRPRGDRRRTLASNDARVVAWARRKETGACPGHDPLARPLPVLSAFGRAVVERGVEKKHSRADMRGPAGSGIRRAEGAGAWATCD